MAKNYCVYPCQFLRITQNYNGKTSHYPHTVGSPKDYPIDEGGADTGRSWLLCPCDKMKVMRIYGVGSRGVNTVWLQSTSKVFFADGTSDYFTMLVTHPEDDDLKKLKVGQTFTRGQKICREGKDGATGNHFHISGGKGKYTGNGWKANTRGKYVLHCTGGAYKPEALFYVDPAITVVISKGGIGFKTLPVNYPTGNYTVNTDTLNVRKGPATTYSKVDSLKKGKKVKIVETDDNWGRYATNKWICLDYCKKS